MTERQRAWLLPAAAPALALGVLLGRETEGWLFPAAGCLLALIAIWVLRSRLRLAACLALALAAGAAAGSLAFHPALPEPGDVTVSGIVADEFRASDYGRYSTVLTDITLNGEPFGAGAYWSFYTEELSPDLIPGKQVSFQATLYHPSGPENPDGYDFREEMLRKRVTVGVYGAGGLDIRDPAFFSFQGFTAGLRHRLSGELRARLGEEAGGYASALLLGIRQEIPLEDREAFSRLGIAHVLSVSGFHVGILVGLLALLFRLCRLPQRLRLLLYAVFLLFYSALCGLNQPVLRASLLVLLHLTGKILNRPRSGLHLLSAAFCVLLLLSPVQLTGVSFQMTFAAMLGLTLVAPWLRERCPFRGRVGRWLWGSMAVFFGAQLGVLLPVLNTYQSMPLLGFFMNFPAALVSTVLITADWVVLALLPIPFLCAPVAAAVSAVSSLILRGIRLIGALPGITLWTPAPNLWTAAGIAGLMLSLSFLFRLRLRARLPAALGSLALVIVSLLPWPHTATEYIQFSVGNADAAVLWDQDQLVVFDTGYTDGTLSAWLRRRRLSPDVVILTHLHTDHATGLKALLRDGIPVSLVCLPEGAEDAAVQEEMRDMITQLRDAGVEVRILALGDRLTLPSGSMTVLWPESGQVRPGQDANFSCLVTLLDLKGSTLLQTGDLDGAYENYAAVPADILKVAHHGSASSTAPEFLETVQPQALLLSCDRMDRHTAVQARMEGIPLFSTAACGAITVHFEDHAFRLEAFLPAGLKKILTPEEPEQTEKPEQSTRPEQKEP